MNLQKRRVAKTMGALAAAALLAAPRVSLARSSQVIRIVNWNIEADTDGISGEGTYGTPAAPIRPGVGTVLAGIGEDNTADNLALAPDILCLEETSQNSITLPPILSALATDYPSITYGSSSLQGLTNGTYEDGNGANALIYNQSALILLNSTGVGTPEGSTNGEYRQVMRYEFQPVGGTPVNDFYVYVSHMKSGATTADVQAQDKEAVIIRNDEATLPAGSSVMYVGDFNNSDTSGSPTPPLETLNASGNGQGNDPANFSTSQQWLSESATDLEYRDDYQLSTGSVINDAGNFDYLDGSLHNFGNNGSPGSNVDSPSTTGGSNTALASLTNPSQAAILNALSTASDHLPVVGDYVAVPNGSEIIYGAQAVSSNTLNPSTEGLYWFDGNAPGNFTFTSGAVFTNAGSFTCDNDRNFTGSGSWQNTGYFGKENTTGTTDFQIPFNNTGTVQITSGNLRFDAGLTSSGTISNTGGGALSASNATFNSGAVVTVTNGTLTVDNTLTNYGSISVSGALSAGSIVNDGVLAIPAGTLNCGDLINSDSLSAPATLSLGNAIVNLSGNLLVGESGPAVGTQSGGEITINNGDSFFAIGQNAGAAGAYTLSGGSINITSTRAIGGLIVGNSGAGTLNVSGGSISVQANFTVGAGTNSVGNVYHSQGSVVVGTPAANKSLTLGYNPQSAGSYTVSGTASLLVNGNLQVGYLGNGSFIQSGGNVLVTSTSGNSGDLIVANASTSSGNFQLSGGTFTANTTYVGGDPSSAGGSGSVTVSGGVLNAGDGILIWPQGVVTLNAGGITNVGSNSSDNIENQGLINSNGGTLNLAGQITGNGTITQSSGQMNLSNQSDLAAGTVVLDGGTAISSGTFLIGTTSPFATGDATFTLNHGTVTINGALGVANTGVVTSGTGSGVLNVNGGILSVTHSLVLGNTNGGDGVANLSSSGFLKAGGLAWNDVDVSGGTLEVDATAPQAGDDPEIMGALVGGYLRNGAMTVSGGYVTAPVMKLGITSGFTGTFTQSAGTVNLGMLCVGCDGTISAGQGTGIVNVSGGALSAGTLLIGSTAGGTGTMALSGSTAAGSVSAVSINGTGVLDVGNSGMVIEYGSGPSPVGDLSFSHTARNYPANSIQAYAQTGIDSLNWDGPGINSNVAENDPTGLKAVGIADENDLGLYPSDFTVAGGGTGTWMGQPINDTNNVLVRMTWYGDGNLDGVVNSHDVTALSKGFNGLAGYVGWSDGDYNYDGTIDRNDVSLLAKSYTFQGAPLGDAITAGQAQYLLALAPDMPANVQAAFENIAGTPEPASLAILATTSIGLLRRRPRQGYRNH